MSERKILACFIVALLILSGAFALLPISTSMGSAILYSDSTVVTQGTQVTSHTLSHASDDSWYQIDSVKLGVNEMIDVEMIYHTAIDPAVLTQIYVFSEAHVASTQSVVDIEIYNYVNALWEFCFSVSATSDANYSYTITTNLANYINVALGGEMRLRMYQKVKLAPQSIYQDYTYIALTAPPVASFTISPSPPNYVGDILTFNASASYDQDGGTIVSYDWDFGDLTTASGVVVTHSYSAEGNYTVTLTVTDEDGLTDVATDTVTILTRPGVPVAIFTYSPSAPLVDETVTFNASDSYDEPPGYIVSWDWDFGDGSVGSGEIVYHVYTAVGDYVVNLTVTDNDSLTNSTTQTIRVSKLPVAVFTYSPLSPLVGETVTFNASDSTPNGGEIISYDWDFGDGATGTGVIVTHVYTTFGTYLVNLTITDSEDLTDWTTKSVTVYSPPVAIFTYSPSVILVGDTVTFDATASYDPDGTILSWDWDFGDGSFGSGEIVTHVYTAVGDYVVNLTVTDNDGLTDSTTQTLTVKKPPVAAFAYSPPAPLVGETVTFDASGSTPNGGTIVSYDWDFGDGTYGSGMIVTHAYAAFGSYVVNLTITDSEGLTDWTTKTVTVYSLPVAAFTYSPPAPLVGETVTFNASTTYDPDGTILSWDWDFGDGSVGSGEIVYHVYTAVGEYVVSLTVTDNDGLTDSTTQTLTVKKPPVAAFTYSPPAPLVGETVTFNASDSTPDGGTIVSYDWDFGDGVTGSGVIVTHAYATFGSYVVNLTITDSEGLTDWTTKTVTVYAPPVAAFTYSPPSPLVGETVTFDASASYDPDGTVISWDWDFGDGNVGSGETVTHAYTAAGNYTVVLTVTDSDSLTDIAIDYVKVGKFPVATFTFSPSAPLVGETVTFDASGSTPNGGTIVSYDWDFGDGSVGSGMIVFHVYATFGSYLVNLTITDSEGLTDWTTKTVTVYSLPVAVFTYSPLSPLVGETVTFDASASYDPDGTVISWDWDFGDGSFGSGEIVTHIYTVEGNYNVTLTVTDNDSLTDSTSQTVTARQPPNAAFTYSPLAPLVGETVTFDASGSTGDIVSYDWDFGDGTYGSGVVVTHVYTAVGDYNVTLTVTDTGALTDTDSQIITVGMHDVAVINVTPSATEAYPDWIVPLNVTVVVKNLGTFSETFDVTAYANASIGTQPVTLASGEERTLTFSWMLTDVLPGNYTISASASVVAGETDTENNNYPDGTVKIKMSGDANGDGVINAFDLGMFGLAWSPNPYDPRADFNGDGVINAFDLGIMGKAWPKA